MFVEGFGLLRLLTRAALRYRFVEITTRPDGIWPYIFAVIRAIRGQICSLFVVRLSPFFVSWSLRGLRVNRGGFVGSGKIGVHFFRGVADTV
jgi:hypothetical protein